MDDTAPIGSFDLIQFALDNRFSVSFHVDGILFLVIGGGVAMLMLLKLVLSRRFKEFEIDEAEFGVGNHKIKIRPNLEDKQIAYKIWIELTTRKIGLEIDLEHDVISEVYYSWYSFFGIARELVKDIPVSKYRSSDTEKIVDLLIEVLNKGVRPHLTSYQAKFRRWYEKACECEENNNLSPQEIQKKYPNYKDLASDLMIVNQNLMRYGDKLRQLVID